MKQNQKESKENSYKQTHFFKDPKSLVSEQFRMLRTNIEFMAIDKNIQTLVITSPTPGDGKTTVAANLAAAFASQKKKVLLVDTDLRKPQVHNFFEINDDLGLSTLFVQQERPINTVVHSTSVPNLYVVPCGHIPPNPAEVLSSERMNQIMSQLKEQFDYVIYDTPPITVVADAQIMAGKVDGTIFVLRKNSDKKTMIRKAKERADAANAHVLGAVFNREIVKMNDKSYYKG